jgi:hypothetical protein
MLGFYEVTDQERYNNQLASSRLITLFSGSPSTQYNK